VLVAGKGHENYQEIEGKRNHFSDKEVVEKHFMLNNINQQ
jgi:UDP-N-acetylmuramoyl-L-alanyl-D-glutamate--2,6-diaminopimelate ligase